MVSCLFYTLLILSKHKLKVSFLQTDLTQSQFHFQNSNKALQQKANFKFKVQYIHVIKFVEVRFAGAEQLWPTDPSPFFGT